MAFIDILRRRAKKQTATQVLGTLSPYQIIGNPIVTEKAFGQIEKSNTYTFVVHNDATKPDVVASLLYLYKVIPLSLRLIRVQTKTRTRRGIVRRAYKKVYVTLKKGDKIELAA